MSRPDGGSEPYLTPSVSRTPPKAGGTGEKAKSFSCSRVLRCFRTFVISEGSSEGTFTARGPTSGTVPTLFHNEGVLPVSFSRSWFPEYLTSACTPVDRTHGPGPRFSPGERVSKEGTDPRRPLRVDRAPPVGQSRVRRIGRREPVKGVRKERDPCHPWTVTGVRRPFPHFPARVSPSSLTRPYPPFPSRCLRARVPEGPPWHPPQRPPGTMGLEWGNVVQGNENSSHRRVSRVGAGCL